jgi:hypothetical protein
LKWYSLRIVLQRLFCKNKITRQEASKRLLFAIVGATGILEDNAIEGTSSVCVPSGPLANIKTFNALPGT